MRNLSFTTKKFALTAVLCIIMQLIQSCQNSEIESEIDPWAALKQKYQLRQLTPEEAKAIPMMPKFNTVEEAEGFFEITASRSLKGRAPLLFEGKADLSAPKEGKGGRRGAAGIKLELKTNPVNSLKSARFLKSMHTTETEHVKLEYGCFGCNEYAVFISFDGSGSPTVTDISGGLDGIMIGEQWTTRTTETQVQGDTIYFEIYGTYFSGVDAGGIPMGYSEAQVISGYYDVSSTAYSVSVAAQ